MAVISPKRFCLFYSRRRSRKSTDPGQKYGIRRNVEIEIRGTVNDDGRKRGGRSQSQPAGIGIRIEKTGTNGPHANPCQKSPCDQETSRAQFGQVLQIIIVGVVLNEIECGCLEFLKRRLVASKPAAKERIRCNEAQRVVPDMRTVFTGNVRETQNHLSRRQKRQTSHERQDQ